MIASYPKSGVSLPGFLSDYSFVKTVLNNLWTHIGYEDDGRLVHTDKKTAFSSSASRHGLV